MVRGTRSAAAACALLAMMACGKKGAPLPPVARVPAAVDQIAARRVGGDVYVTVTVPARNIDASMPADVARIEVYGYTGRSAPPRARWTELGTLVATVPVDPPPAPGEEPQPAPVAPVGAAQGSQVTIRDTLAPEELIPALPGPAVATTPSPPSPSSAASPAEVEIHRYYLAIAISPRGRPGPPGTAAEILLPDLPSPPGGVQVRFTERAVSVDWLPVPAPTTPGAGTPLTPGAPGPAAPIVAPGVPAAPAPAAIAPPPPVGAPAAVAPPPPAGAPAAVAPVGAPAPVSPAAVVPAPPAGAPPAGALTPPAGATAAVPAAPINMIRYNVYRDLGPDPPGAPAAPSTPWNEPAPAPLNPTALETTTFSDEVQFGRERCYTVRTLFGTGRAAVESVPSARVCVTPADVFPPAAPAQPATVAGEGAITLIWEPNREPDVAGYLVLRGEPGDATLRPLTPTPIADTSYRDVTVMQGRRYVYAVVAVDNRAPLPNASVPSASVEETAR